MSKDIEKWLQSEYPAIFEAVQKGYYSDVTIYTFEDWRAGKINYIHPTAQPVTEAKNAEKRYLDILPPTEAERIKNYRIETAERLINNFLEPRKKAFEALPPNVQTTEREAIKTALKEETATLIKAPTGDICPAHTAKQHQSPANYIASAYKYVTDANYFQEVRQTPPEDITKHSYLMAEALRRYLNWIDSQEGSKAEKKAKPQADPLPAFEDLTEPIEEALKNLDLLSETGKYIGKAGQIKTLFNALERKGYLVGNRSTTEHFSRYFETTFSGKITGRALRKPLTTKQEQDLRDYKAALPKK